MLSEIRSENLTDSGHMTELKTEVDNCKKIIKFLETEIGCKNDTTLCISEEIVSFTVSMYELVADGGGLSGVDDGLFSWRAAGRDSAQLENLLSDHYQKW
jgi:hypothetical protein